MPVSSAASSSALQRILANYSQPPVAYKGPGDIKLVYSAALSGPLRMNLLNRILDWFGRGDGPVIRSLIDQVCDNSQDITADAMKLRMEAFVALRARALPAHQDKFNLAVRVENRFVENNVPLSYEFSIDGTALIEQTFRPDSTHQAMILLRALPDPDTLPVNGAMQQRVLASRDAILLSNLFVTGMRRSPAPVSNYSQSGILHSLSTKFDAINSETGEWSGKGIVSHRAKTLEKLVITGDCLRETGLSADRQFLALLEVKLPDRESMTVMAGHAGLPVYQAHFNDSHSFRQNLIDTTKCIDHIRYQGLVGIADDMPVAMSNELNQRAIAEMCGADNDVGQTLCDLLNGDAFSKSQLIGLTEGEHDFVAEFEAVRLTLQNGTGLFSGDLLKKALLSEDAPYQSLQHFIAIQYALSQAHQSVQRADAIRQQLAHAYLKAQESELIHAPFHVVLDAETAAKTRLARLLSGASQGMALPGPDGATGSATQS